MTTASELVRRNADFAESRSVADLTLSPRGNLMIIGCVDPRVDPATVLGLDLGEAAVIRNVGGRLTPATFRTLAMLAKVGEANQDTRPPGEWNLVILHHTDCGMTDLADHPDLLAGYFEIPTDGLPGKAVSDPVASVRVDAEIALTTLHADDYYVTGLVYDVETGRVETVVPATALRP